MTISPSLFYQNCDNRDGNDVGCQSDNDFVLWNNNCDLAQRLVESLILSIFATVEVHLVTY